MTKYPSKLMRSDAGNCWVYGCATVAVLGIVGVVVAAFGVRYMFAQAVENFTDDSAVPMPVVEATDEEKHLTIDRVDAWVESLEEETATQPLRLSQQDINILIQHHPENEEFSQYMYVTLDGSEIEGEVSVPLDEMATELNWESLQGRYFNGSVKLELSFSNGQLSVFINEANLKGEDISESFMAGIRSQNLAENSNRDPDMAQALEQVEAIEIVGGELIITPKGMKAPETEKPLSTEVLKKVDAI